MKEEVILVVEIRIRENGPWEVEKVYTPKREASVLAADENNALCKLRGCEFRVREYVPRELMKEQRSHER